MPRAGHRYGPHGCPPELAHYEARLGIRLTASKLTRRHREIAQGDPAVASHLQRRIREPARYEALMAGRTRFTSDTTCGRCGSSTRTVYSASCWTCAMTRRPLHTGSSGRVTSWPPARQSRAGFLDRADRSKRDPEAMTFGPFDAVQHPLGKLSVTADSLNWSCPDLRTLDFNTINNLVRRYPEFLELLEWAGWT